MRKTVIKTILKNRWRQEYITLKNWLAYYVLFGFGVGFMLLTIPELLAVARAYEHQLRVGICVLLCYLMFCKRFPVLYVNPANFHFLKERQDIHFLLVIRLLLSLAVFAVFGSLWAIITDSPLAGIHLFVLLWLWLLLTWQRYHHSAPLGLLAGEMLIAAAFFALQWLVPGLLIAGGVLLLQMHKLFTLNLHRYLSDMSLFFTIQAAGARLDWTTMIAIGNTLSIKEHYAIAYPQGAHLHPLLKKSLLDTLRAAKNMHVLVLFFILCALIALLTNLLTPFGPLVFTLLWSMALSTFINQSVDAALKMAAKHEKGLFLPYNQKTLAIYYSVWPTLEATILQIGLALFTPVQLLPSLLTCALLALLIFLWHHLRLRHPLWQHGINMAASALLMLTNGCLVLFL